MPQRQRKESADQLPPHSIEAEQGVLGCILLSAECFAEAVERFGDTGEHVFYDIRHKVIFHAMTLLFGENRPVNDMVTLTQKLRDQQQLEGIGGVAYLSGLPDVVPSAENLAYYLDIVWQKHLARRAIQLSVDTASRLFAVGEMTEPILADIRQRVEELQRAADRQKSLVPPRLKRVVDFADDFNNRWFGADAEEPGRLLPFAFPFKIRDGELTFFLGEKGAGKTSMLSYILLHLVHQMHSEETPAMCGLASMEMQPSVSLWILAAQLLGQKRLPDTDDGRRRAAHALAWLNSRFVVYDFLGIADWRDILRTFQYAREHNNARLFLIDSVMRLGIPDDDYAQQGLAAASFAQFCVGTGSHIFLVNHLNKSDRDTKSRSRGSQQWIDNSHNVCSLHRNETKVQKVDKLKQDLKTRKIDNAEYSEKVAELRTEWDCYWDLHNQRWPGSQQNGRKYLYFDHSAFQFHEAPGASAVCWFDRWKRKQFKPDPRTETA